MSRTVSTTLTNGITLVSGDDPVSVTSTGRITAAGNGYAIYGPGGGSNNWTVSNSGTLIDTITEGVASEFGDTGTHVAYSTFTNQSGGLITSSHNGVGIAGPGAITNMSGGTIISNDAGLASAVYLGGPGTIVNGGLVRAVNVAVYDPVGAQLTNLATGTILGAGGVYFLGPGTVTNAGTITGTSATYGAVLFASVTGPSRLIADPGAVFNGQIISRTGSTNVIELASGASAGTLAGFDGATITNFATLQFDSGAAWTVKGTSAASGLGSIAITGFAQGDTIDVTGFAAVSKTFASNALTLTNAGNAHTTLHIQGAFSAGNFTIASDGNGGTDITGGTTMTLGHTAAGTYSAGLTLTSTAASNPFTVTGKISVAGGVALTATGGHGWTVTNSGTVLSTFTAGNGLLFGTFGNYVTSAVLTNKSGGLISATGTLGYGVDVYGPGSVTNLLGGTISAGHIAVDFNSSAGTIVNYGVLLATGNVAAYEREGGIITNLAGGTISGSTGVWFQYAAGTFTNAGTVIGSNSQDGAVLFNDQTSSNLLIVDPGAVFSGGISGGHGMVQLASAASAGSLNGFNGASITNFGTLQFNTGAKWTVIGNTLAAGLGTVAITGFTFNDTIDLTGFAAVSETFASNALTLTNGSNAHATLHIQGAFASNNFTIASYGAGTGTGISFGTPASALVYGQTIDETGIVATTETVSAGVMTLKNGGGTVVGTVGVGTSLSTGDFALVSDGSSGTDVIVTSVFGTYASGVTLLTRPTTITATGRVSNAAASGNAVSGPTGTNWTITNLGTVAESGATAPVGISLAASGTVINSGAISAATTAGNGVGVSLAAGGVVTNQSGGTITGFLGVYNSSGAVTVVNAGDIAGDPSTGKGITLKAAGTVTNQSGGTISGGAGAVRFAAGVTNLLAVNPGAVFTGTVDGGNTAGATSISTLELASGASAGTLSGLGSEYIGFNAVTIDAGANWTFSGANTLIAGVTLTDSGTLSDSGTFTNAGRVTGAAKGVILTTGARVTNQTGGTIVGGTIGISAGGIGTVVNSGVISGGVTASAASGISFAAGGSVTNQTGGTISGSRAISEQTGTLTVINAGSVTGGSGASRAGIALNGGGTISNQSGGTITGNYGVIAYASGVTVTNAGGIIGVYGVLLNAAGGLTNQSGGTISGSSEGVLANAGATVTNAGIITGAGYGVQLAAGGTVIAQSGGTISSAGTAVSFGTSRTNRLVVYPGASFTGKVDGGNAIGASSISTLELASSASAGTFGGLGSQFTKFAQVTVDAGARWTFSGTQTGFATLTNAGSVGGNSTYGIKAGASTTGVTVINQLGGAITGSTDAIYVITGSGTGTVSNAGHIIGGSSGFAAINLSGGGGVTNAAGGTISGLQAGIFIANGTSASVSNAGSVSASQSYGIWLLRAGSVNNTSGGQITGGYATQGAAGVYLGDGGTVTNQSGGTVGGLRGVYVLTGAAMVVNAGHIVGGDTTIGDGAAYTGAGVYLGAGGSVTNQASGTIGGYFGVRAANVAATVVNAGVIAGAYTSDANHADGVYMSHGGTVTNQAGGTIYAANDGVLITGTRGTVINLGTIHSHIGGYGGRGVSLDAGGLIINGTSGGTVSTAFIAGYNYAVQFGATGTGTLVNYGTVYGPTGTVAVSMLTGTIINGLSGASGALIKSGLGSNAIQIGGPGTVTNYGTINGNAVNGSSRIAYGISLSGSGTVASSIGNLGSNALILGYVAVYAAQNATVTNAGTMEAYQTFGGSIPLEAVVFGGGTNRLIVDPGAAFIGNVSGGGPVTVAPGGNTIVLGTANGIGTTTLELASAATAGTLAGFGTSIYNFASLVFDGGARWTVTGNAAAAGLGTLPISGFTFGDTVDLTGFVAVSRTFAANSLVLTNGANAHATLAIGSTLATGNFSIVNDGSGGTDITLQPLLIYAETLDQTGIVATTETVTAGVMTLKNGGGTAVGTLAVGTSLSSGDFSLAPNGGDTNVVVHTATGTYSNGLTLLVNPTTIGSVATIGGTAANVTGVTGPSGTAWTLTNKGLVSETGTGANGISFATGGLVTNAAGGTVIAGKEGIVLTGGGQVVNQFGGTISGYRGIDLGAAGTVVNAGGIGGGTATSTGAGIIFRAGGVITNQATGAITAFNAIYGTIAYLSVVNAGTIGGNASLGSGISATAGANVTNQTGGKLTGLNGIRVVNGAAFVVNQGTITGGTAGNGHGVFLGAGGYFSNKSSGTITGKQGIVARGSLILVNSGSIGAISNVSAGVTAGYGGTLTNLAAGRITGYDGVAAGGGATVVNGGTITGVSGTGVGVVMSGGTLTAQSTGTISGGADAVLFGAGYTGRLVFNKGAVFTGTVDGGNTVGATSVSTLELTSAVTTGTLSNLGTKYIHFGQITIDAAASWSIASGTLGVGYSISDSGTLTNAARIGSAATLTSGARLTNNVGGTISTTGAAIPAVSGSGGPVTVVNAGSIAGNLTSSAGVYLALGGLVTNQLGGTISGLHGIDARNAQATVVNAGVIQGNQTAGGGYGVYLALGGTVTNQATGTISGLAGGVTIGGAPGTVLNLGNIHAAPTSPGGWGVYLAQGGVLTNGQAGGTVSTASILGYSGGVNFGTGAGTVTNYGTIDGTPGNPGVRMNAGTVINGAAGATGARIIDHGVNGVSIGGAGTVVNNGTIAGGDGTASYYGVFLGGEGGVSNLGTASLIYAASGIFAASNDTVTNAGTIKSDFGTAGLALKFGGGINRLIVDPGAVFVGSIAAAGSTTLELTSAASAGTLAGFGTSITNFTSVVFDSSARWTVRGNASASGLGALGIGGFDFGDTIDLTGFVAVTRTFAANMLVLTNGTNAHATLAIGSTLATGNFSIVNDGSGGTDISLQPLLIYAETIDEASIVATTETVTAGVMALKNGGGTVVGNIAVGTSLSTGDFSLVPNGGDTNVVVQTATGTYGSGLTLLVNPTTIGSVATVSNTAASGAAVAGPSGTAWTLTNLGSIAETGTAGYGISFASFGTITNTASVTGGRSGIMLAAGGSVTNQSGGTISGTYGIYAVLAGSTVVNAGSIGDGASPGAGMAIVLRHGGTITNQTDGNIIAGQVGIFAGTAAPAGIILAYGAPAGATITNAGSIGGGSTSGDGISFASGGVVNNQTGGVITGDYGILGGSASVTVFNAGSIGGNATIAGSAGVDLGAAGAVSNQTGGTITGLRGVVATGGTVANLGTIAGNATSATGVGVQLLSGAALNNQSGGTISGFTSVYGKTTAVTVVNTGNIGLSTTATNTTGVSLTGGGTVSNQSGGTITAQIGVRSSGTTVTVMNAGSIGGDSTSGAAVTLTAGGYVSNASGGTLSGSYGVGIAGGAGTVVNAGSLGDGTSLSTGAAVALKLGGSVTNQTGGQIVAGLQAIYFGGAAGTLINAGTVAGGPTSGNGVIIANGALITNQAGGVITGKYAVRGVSVAVTVVNYGRLGGNATASGAAGVNLGAGGAITNRSGGTITGRGGVSITSGTVVNAGTIAGSLTTATGTGVLVSGGAGISNQASGTITGFTGVYGSSSTTTVTNAGSIGGATASGLGINLKAGGTVTNQSGGMISGGAAAVTFAAGFTNRLVFDPGAVFSGTVDGGNTIGASFDSTLELASGVSTGTLSGLGSAYTNFARTTIDSGAIWVLTGTNSVVAGATVSIAGTLAVTGTMFNAGTVSGYAFQLSGGTLTNQTSGLVTSAYVYGVSAGGADFVVNQGSMTEGTAFAIYLKDGGTVSNAAGASISAQGAAVKIKGAGATVSNLGRILSPNPDGYGVYLRDGGLITNGQSGVGASTASIAGYYGLTFKTADTTNAQATLVNYGTVEGVGIAGTGALLNTAGTVFNGLSGATAALIQGARYGVYSAQGQVTNNATIIATGGTSGDYGVAVATTGGISNLGTAALIEGYGGVLIGTDGTVVNSGTIESNQGASGVAVKFTDGDTRLIDNPGAVFIGSIYGGSGGTAVLELTAGTGTISGLGATVTNFTSLVFDGGARWTVRGNDAANGLGTLGIAGFTTGDTIDLTGFAAGSRTAVTNGLVLTNGGSHVTLDILGTFSTANFTITPDSGGGTDITFDPLVVTAAGTVSFNGGGTAVVLDGALAVVDSASTILAGATVSIGGFVSGDLLNFTGQNGIGGSYDASTGTLTLSGAATVTDYQAALESITYSFNPGDGDPTNGGGATTRSIAWVATDGANVSGIGSSALGVIHAPPVITTGGGVSFIGGGGSVALDATLTVADPDSLGLLTSGTVVISGFQAGDILSANTIGTAIGESYNAGTLTLTGTDTLADYQAVLRSVAYSVNPANLDPTAGGSHTSRVIDWQIVDRAAVSNVGSSALTEMHVAPSVTASGTANFIGGGSAVVLDSGLSVTDADSGGTLTGATIAIATGLLAGDTLNFTNQNSITGKFDGSTGILTLSGTASVANYQTALASITYSFDPSDGDPTNRGAETSRVIDWAVTDGSTGNGVSNTGTSMLDTVHVAPAITTSGTVSFTGGGAAVALDPGLTAGDVDSGGALTGATITIASGGVDGDMLSFTSQSKIKGSFDSSTGVLTLSGAATVATYQAVLASVAYGFSPFDGDPTGGGGSTSRTIDWTVSDGSTSNGVSNTGSSTLDIVHVAPGITVSGTVSFTGGGLAVILGPGVTVSDPDSGGELTGATVSIASGRVAGDTLNFTGQNGITGSFDSTTGVLTLSGAATIAHYQSALASVSFSASPSDADPTGGGASASRTIDWVVSDGSTSNGSSNTGSSTLGTVHVAPTIAAGGTVTFAGGGSPVLLDGGVVITDPDSGGNLTGASVRLASGLATGDTLSFTNQNSITGNFDGSTGVLTLTGTATIANYETALDSVTYRVNPSNLDPTNGGADTSRAIEWVVRDGSTSNGISNSGSSTLNTVHVAPAIAASGTVSFGGGGPAVILDPELTVSDPDSGGDLSGAVISIVSGHVAGDTLNFIGQNGIAGSFDASAGVLTLSGNASVAQYQAALASITFGVNPSNLDPTDGGGGTSRVIDWVVTDGSTSNGISNTGSSALETVHAPPTVAAGGTVTFTGGGPAVVLDSSIGIADPDSSGNLTGATVQIASGHASGDILTFANQNGITGGFDSATGILTLTGDTTILNYETALASVTFGVDPSNLDPTNGGGDTSRVIDWVVSDGSTSNGISNTGSSTLNTVHVRPTVAAGGTVTFTGGGPAVVLDSGIGLTDPDSGGTLTGAVVTIVTGHASGDILGFINENGITGSFNSSSGVLTLSGSATIQNYQSALASVTFGVNPADVDPTNGGGDTSRTIEWVVSDGSTSNGISNTGSSTLNTVHVGPTLSASGTVAYTDGGAAAMLVSGPTIGDPDSAGMLTGATVAITGGFLAGDTLAFATQNGINGGYNATTGVLTLTGGARVANYLAALQSITYAFVPGNVDPTSGNGVAARTVSWSVSDGVAGSNTATTAITVTLPPPVIAGASAGQAGTDAAPISPFPAVSIGDADSSQIETVTIALSNTANGALSNTGTGSYDTNSGVYAVSGTEAAVTAAIGGLVFTPTPHQVTPGNSVTSAFTITATDADGGTSSDGTTTFGAVAVNDAPAISGQVFGQTIADNATIQPFAGVTIGDPDLGATETVTITLTGGDANGVLTGAGLTRTGAGVYTLTTGTPGTVTALLDALVFIPTAHQVAPGDTASTGMTLSVSDGIAGAPVIGEATSVMTTALLTVPSVVGAVANQGVPDETPSRPFANVSEVEPDFGATETVTVTLSAPGNGTLSDLSGGTYDAVAGVYSVTGSATADTAAFEALVFTPIAQPNTDVSTTFFAISPGAGGAADTTTSVTSVKQILGLASVPANQIAISVSPDGSAFAAPLNGMTNEAVVADPVDGDTYPVPTGYQAMFLGGTAGASLTDTVAGNALLVANSGNDALIAGAANDTLAAGAGGDSLVGGSFASTVVGSSGPATVFAGAGAVRVISGSGPISFGGTGNAGSSISGGSGPGASDLSANLSGQNQIASVGASAATITAAGSGNTIIGGTSTLNVTLSGSANTVQAGSGANTVVSSGSSNVVIGGSVSGSGGVTVTETGSNDTIVGGASPTTVTASTSTGTSVSGGSGSLTFVGGTGTSTVMGGTGSVSIAAGSGGVVFDAGTSNNATVNSGGGGVTVFGSSGTTVNLTGTGGGSASQPNFAVAGGSGETLSAANSGSATWLSVNTTVSSSAATLIAGTGNDTLIAGGAPGSTTMTGGNGSDAFVFFRQAVGGAHDVVNDFTQSDAVYIEGYGAGSAAALQSAATVSTAGVTMTLSDGTTITFSNLTSQTALNGRIEYG